MKEQWLDDMMYGRRTFVIQSNGSEYKGNFEYEKMKGFWDIKM